MFLLVNKIVDKGYLQRHETYLFAVPLTAKSMLLSFPSVHKFHVQYNNFTWCPQRHKILLVCGASIGKAHAFIISCLTKQFYVVPKAA